MRPSRRVFIGPIFEIFIYNVMCFEYYKLNNFNYCDKDGLNNIK